MPALESAHAVAHAMRAAARMKKSESVVVGLSGRGDKDVHTVAQALAAWPATGTAATDDARAAAPTSGLAARRDLRGAPRRAASARSSPTSPRAIPRSRRRGGSCVEAARRGADVIELGIPFSDPARRRPGDPAGHPARARRGA